MPKYLYKRATTCTEIGILEAVSPEAAKLVLDDLDNNRDKVSEVRVAYDTRLTVGDETPLPAANNEH